ncbi:hypothetical protein V2J09_013235 [Rumex salicifolius]
MSGILEIVEECLKSRETNTCNGFYCDYFSPNKAYKPKMWTEAWTGWFTEFGGPHGGTNFGRTAGGPFIATTYDYDAPLDEFGMTFKTAKMGSSLHNRAIKLYEPALISGDPALLHLETIKSAAPFLF